MSIAFCVIGCLCNFLCVGKSRNKEKNRTWCFVERKIKKTTLEHPFFLYAILFLNNKHVKLNDVANQILSYSLLIFFKQFHC